MEDAAAAYRMATLDASAFLADTFATAAWFVADVPMAAELARSADPGTPSDGSSPGRHFAG
jgi:hypothetical protein